MYVDEVAGAIRFVLLGVGGNGAEEGEELGGGGKSRLMAQVT